MKTATLRKRLVSLNVIQTTLILSIAWIFVSLNDFLVFKELMLQKQETAIKIVSRNLAACLNFKDKEECDRVLKTVTDESIVDSAVLTDNSLKVFSSSNFIGNSAPEKNWITENGNYNFFIEGDYIYSWFPVYEGTEYLGRVYLKGEYNLFKTFLIRHALVFLLIAIMSIFLSTYLSGHLQQKISLQLGLILKAMNRIRREKMYNLRISKEEQWKSVDIVEFQEFGDSFDAMIDQIEVRDKSLEAQNVSLEKVIEEKVKEILRTAELASLGEMAGGIAHEINNPLTIISSTNHILQMELKHDTINKDLVAKLLSNIETTVARIAKIVTGLRNLSRKSSDTDISPCTFTDVFNDVFEVASAKFKSKGIDIRKSFSEELTSVVFLANRIQLSQVFVNLLNNSFDAITEFKATDLWIEIAVTSDTDTITMRFIDCGKGIPAEVRAKMFNPFFTTKEVGKGTGIGLSLSKSMVEKMGGVFYYDEKSPNTSFVIQLKRTERPS